MSIVRVTKDKNYFHASNEPFNDPAMSWGARGIMGYLLSKPDGWEVRNFDLYRKSPDGRRKVNGYLDELKTAGYLRRYKVYKPAETGRGSIIWVTEIYERKEMNPDNLRCIQNVNVEDVSVKSVNIEDGSHIDITNPAITNPAITERENTPPQKLNGKATVDPIAHLLAAAQRGVSEDSAPNPDDQWFVYRNEMEKSYTKFLRRPLAADDKDDIVDYCEKYPQDTPADFDKVLTECRHNWTGGGHCPWSRIEAVRGAGGTWAQWKERTYPQADNGNGQQPKPQKERKPILDPRTGEPTGAYYL